MQRKGVTIEQAKDFQQKRRLSTDMWGIWAIQTPEHGDDCISCWSCLRTPTTNIEIILFDLALQQATSLQKTTPCSSQALIPCMVVIYSMLEKTSLSSSSFRKPRIFYLLISPEQIRESEYRILIQSVCFAHIFQPSTITTQISLLHCVLSITIFTRWNSRTSTVTNQLQIQHENISLWS